VIYPVIEGSERQDLRAATVEYEKLAAGPLSGLSTALLHGRLRSREKAAIMARFAAGEISLLVATTVVEVGVDVPNATTMLIHHPERYGLAQLHQLRGRIGRGVARSVCCLIVDRWLAAETRERLEFFAAHHDGFRLAEEDLRRRGPGDLLGVRQHGLPSFRLANPLRDAQLVRECAADAAVLLRRDPRLGDPAHRSLREAVVAAERRLAPPSAGG
jgi:ATP-dependent DNA helicase RecG